MIKAEELVERLYQHIENYEQGKTQDFEKVFSDCKLAADMIKILKASKHTQKRQRQRLSKKNRDKTKQIEALTAEIAVLRNKNSVKEADYADT
jgi:hypothetical protein